MNERARTPPDRNPFAVRWVPLADLPAAPLLPRLAERILRVIASPPEIDPFGEGV